MDVRQRARASGLILAAAAAALVARTVRERGGPRGIGSLALRRGRPRARSPEESRLYARGGRRLETHLGRRHDGRRVVVAVGVDGSGRAAVYAVDEAQPWPDFERQAGLRHAAWGPCRDLSAGL